MNIWLQIVLDFIFPAQCVYCQHFVGDDRVLIFCRSCWETMPVITTSGCGRCGQPFSSNQVLPSVPAFLCGDCRTSTPYFDRAFSATYYEGVVKEAILQFKFHHKIGLGKALAEVLIAQIPSALKIAEYDLLLPVPLHKTHQRQRGYNQSVILAQQLARHYGIPLLLHNLLRIRQIKTQSQLRGRQARRDNVKNAFYLRYPQAIYKQRVILVDDVFTTGTTVNECAKILKQAGACSVLALTLSRAHFTDHASPGSEIMIKKTTMT